MIMIELMNDEVKGEMRAKKRDTLVAVGDSIESALMTDAKSRMRWIDCMC